MKWVLFVFIVGCFVWGWFVLGVFGNVFLSLAARRTGLRISWAPDVVVFLGPINFLIGVGFLVFVFGSELVDQVKKWRGD